MVLESLDYVESWCQDYTIPRKSKDVVNYEDLIKEITDAYNMMDSTMLKVQYIKLILLQGYSRYITPCESNIFQYIMSRYDAFYTVYTNRYRWCIRNFTRVNKILSKGVDDVPQDIIESIKIIIKYLQSYDKRVNTSILPSYKQYSILRYIKCSQDVDVDYPEDLIGGYNEYSRDKLDDVVNHMYSLYNDCNALPEDKLEAAESMWTSAIVGNNSGGYIHSLVFEKLMRQAKDSKDKSYILLCADEDGDVHYVNGTSPTDYRNEMTIIHGKERLEFILGFMLTNYPNYKFKAIEFI